MSSTHFLQTLIIYKNNTDCTFISDSILRQQLRRDIRLTNIRFYKCIYTYLIIILQFNQTFRYYEFIWNWLTQLLRTALELINIVIKFGYIPIIPPIGYYCVFTPSSNALNIDTKFHLNRLSRLVEGKWILIILQNNYIYLKIWRMHFNLDFMLKT